MNIASESISLSKHLMLFLTAAFTFSMKELLTDPSWWVVALLIGALTAAVVSFSLGYVVIFQILKVETENPATDSTAPLPRAAKMKLQRQYIATMVALLLLASSVGIRLVLAVVEKG